MNLILEKSFLQGVIKASRIQNQSKTLIDHILFNSNSSKIFTGTLISDVSDHFFTYIARPSRSKPANTEHKNVYLRNFSSENLANFKAALGWTDWNTVMSSDDVDTSFDLFWSKYKECYDANFPLKRVRFNKNIHKKTNFMTKGLLTSRLNKIKLHKIAISSPSAVNIQAYKNFKSVYLRTVRAAKKMYITSKLQQNAGNPKKTWDTLNEILGKRKNKESIECVNVGGNLFTDPCEIASQFNTFFTSIGQKISNNIPAVYKNFEDYMDYGRPIPDLLLVNTTSEHIKKIIKNFKPKYSCDVDGVSTKMVKYVGAELAIPLSHIFNLSIENGYFPSKLKSCRVIPIFKSGNTDDCDNYRPISLLSSLSKVLEKIVADNLVHHLLSNDLLYCNQFGFLPKRSTEHNLMKILNYVSEALNDGNFCIGVFLDLKKAFDVCSHEILLSKLKIMGIRGKNFNWFKSYLSGRKQKVDIDGVSSSELPINISVIQGSILGPILFLCYINDFYKATSLFSVLFADDTTCLAKGKILNELTEYVNAELQKVANWFLANKMAVNTRKTKFIVFRTHGKKIVNEDCVLLFNSNEIGKPADNSLIFQIDRIHNAGPERSFKLLGVLFDEYLSFDEHINSLCTKLSKSLFCLRRVKNFIDQNTLKTLYFAMIHSHIVYCLSIYGCANTTSLQKIRIKQKESIRIICNAPYRAHTAPLFKQLHILPLDELIRCSSLKFMHNFVNQKLPFTFSECWLTNRQRNPNRNLRNINDLYVPAHHFATVKRFPFYTFPRLWNEEPERKSTPSLNVYLKNLKKSLLDSIPL